MKSTETLRQKERPPWSGKTVTAIFHARHVTPLCHELSVTTPDRLCSSSGDEFCRWVLSATPDIGRWKNIADCDKEPPQGVQSQMSGQADVAFIWICGRMLRVQHRPLCGCQDCSLSPFRALAKIYTPVCGYCFSLVVLFLYYDTLLLYIYFFYRYRNQKYFRTDYLASVANILILLLPLTNFHPLLKCRRASLAGVERAWRHFSIGV